MPWNKRRLGRLQYKLDTLLMDVIESRLEQLPGQKSAAANGSPAPKAPAVQEEPSQDDAQQLDEAMLKEHKDILSLAMATAAGAHTGLDKADILSQVSAAGGYWVGMGGSGEGVGGGGGVGRAAAFLPVLRELAYPLCRASIAPQPGFAAFFIARWLLERMPRLPS